MRPRIQSRASYDSHEPRENIMQSQKRFAKIINLNNRLPRERDSQTRLRNH